MDKDETIVNTKYEAEAMIALQREKVRYDLKASKNQSKFSFLLSFLSLMMSFFITQYLVVEDVIIKFDNTTPVIYMNISIHIYWFAYLIHEELLDIKTSLKKIVSYIDQ